MIRPLIIACAQRECADCRKVIRRGEWMEWRGDLAICGCCAAPPAVGEDFAVTCRRSHNFGDSYFDPKGFAKRVREHVAEEAALNAPFVALERDRALAREATMTALRAEGELVPSANRGLKGVGESEGPVLAIIDFLTFTAPWARMVEGAGAASAIIRARAVEGEESSQLAIAEWLVDEAFPESGLRVDAERRGFRNFYANHFRLLTPDGDQCGFVAMGGERQRGTVCVEVTGSGCAHVKAWAHVAAFLDTMQARITRVDCAHDDFDGRCTLDDVKQWHAEGKFRAGEHVQGRNPALNVQGWDDGSGQSVYIGKNTGNQQLCAYEKGRQQGARDGDPQAKWIRLEGRFGSKYRTITTDVLTNPAAYLVGHFPALSVLLRHASARMRTSKERAAANLHSAVRHAKRQTGALLNLIKKHVPETEFGDWIVRHVVRDRLPAWLPKIPFGADAIRFSFQT